VPHFDPYGGPPSQSCSESHPSPIQRRATPPKRDDLKGENPGSLRGVQVRKCGEGACVDVQPAGEVASPKRVPPATDKRADRLSDFRWVLDFEAPAYQCGQFSE
jgi:hypothetical protein